MPFPDVGVVRGEVWQVPFDPSEGDEIRKIRPAIVMDIQDAGRMQLHIVVPVTGWQPQFARYFWMIHIPESQNNGLSKESAADAFQVKSLSSNRFQVKLGVVNQAELADIATAIALCIGFST